MRSAAKKFIQNYSNYIKYYFLVVKNDIDIEVDETPEANDEFPSSSATKTVEENAEASKKSSTLERSISSQETSKEDDMLPTACLLYTSPSPRDS